MAKTKDIGKIKQIIFLKDALLIALSAFGGPEMHLALYHRRLVENKKYLTKEELLELYSLCQMLPGPTSTQTLACIGYKYGGPFLAFLTLLIWILPAAIIMTAFSLLYNYLPEDQLMKSFRFIQPLVVALICIAAFKMVKSIKGTRLVNSLIIGSFAVAALLRHPIEGYFKTPWMFPIILVIGGVISYFVNRDYIKYPKEKLHFPWRYLVVFAGIFVGAGILIHLTDLRIVKLFENTYRFGSMVFGGGTVLIPFMYEQFVSHNGYLTPDMFISGFGLVQAIPGPIFSFTTFTTGLAMREFGTTAQILGCGVGTIGIFLPGMLMIYFVYPVWEQLKKSSVVQRSLEGVIAASAGLVAAAAYLLFLPVGLKWKTEDSFFYTNLEATNFVNWVNIVIILVFTILLVKFPKVPTPIWVILALLAGILI